MTNFPINSTTEALEAAEQYRELGLPLPVDLVAYLTDCGLIVTDQSEVHEYMFNEQEMNNG